MDETSYLIIGIIIGVFGCFVTAYFYVQSLHQQHEKDKRDVEKETRKDSKKRQRRAIKGEISERIVPFLTEKTGCTGTELKHLGKPIDWIGFQGIDDNPKNKEVTVKFFEVKSGDKISWDSDGREKAIRDAIKEGRVEWELIKINQKEIDEFFDENLDIEIKS
jgi:predicted Holliday junction resolvase-like endonuclease